MKTPRSGVSDGRAAARRGAWRTAVTAVAVALVAACLAVASVASAGARVAVSELQLNPAIGSLATSWSATGTRALAGFRLRWRPMTTPASPWSKPVELGAQARAYQLSGLPANAAVYEVRVRAIVAVTPSTRLRRKRATRPTRRLAGLAAGAATTLSPGEVLQPLPESPREGEPAKGNEPPTEQPREKEPPKEKQPKAKEPPREKERLHRAPPPHEPHEEPPHEPPHKEPPGEPPHEEPPHEPPHEEPPHEPPHEEPPGGSGCALYGSPSGNDASAGTQAAPLRTVNALLGKLHAGQTGCLAPGSYEGFTARPGESNGSAGAPVTITSTDPQAPATIAGRAVTMPGADYLTFSHLDFNDPSVTPPSVTIGSAHTSWTYDDVTAPYTICFNIIGQGQYGPGEDTLIEHDRVHNCGQPFACEADSTPCNESPSNGYFIHGLYDLGVRTTVRNSYFYADSSKGILLRGSSGSVVEHNVIDGNGSGVAFGDLTPVNDIVRWNIITNSHGVCGSCLNYYGVWTFGSLGAGNSVANNDIFGNVSGNLADLAGVNVAENIEVDPLFVDAAGHDYTLQLGSPVLGYGPQ